MVMVEIIKRSREHTIGVFPFLSPFFVCLTEKDISESLHYVYPQREEKLSFVFVGFGANCTRKTCERSTLMFEWM